MKDQQKLNTKVISVENFLSTTTIKSLGAFYFQYIDNFLKFQCLLLCDEEKWVFLLVPPYSCGLVTVMHAITKHLYVMYAITKCLYTKHDR